MLRKLTDKFVEWCYDNFVYDEVVEVDTGKLIMSRFYPFPTIFQGKVLINVIYGEYDLFHTHISSFFSIILYGGYSERIWNGGENYTERSVNFWNKKRHDEVHLTDLYKEKCISLLFFGPFKTRQFRYLVDGKLIWGLRYWKQKGFSKEDVEIRPQLPRKRKLSKSVEDAVNAFQVKLDMEK